MVACFEMASGLFRPATTTIRPSASNGLNLVLRELRRKLPRKDVWLA